MESTAGAWLQPAPQKRVVLSEMTMDQIFKIIYMQIAKFHWII